MTRVYDFAAKLSGSLALVCAILAVLATPSSARADQLSDCMAACQGLDQDEYSQCMGECMNGITLCSRGTPDCGTYLTEGDCEPGFNNKCFNSNVNCARRWRPAGGVFKCVCNNITGK